MCNHATEIVNIMEKKYILFLLLIFVVANPFLHELSASPFSPEAYRTYLNGQWQFKTDLYNIGEQEGWFKTNYKTQGWDTMEVPGNWDLKNEYADYVGKGWYRRTFEVPESWGNENVRLVFEAVYNDAQVWINGEAVGEHHVGFLPFWFDINEYLKFGEENTIVVVADNTFKRGAIWNWGGIRRPVWLETTPRTRLEYQHLSATPDLKHGTAEVELAFEVSNLGEQEQSVGYHFQIFYEDQEVWSSNGRGEVPSFKIGPGEKAKRQLSLTLPKSEVYLWHFNHPHLYRAELSLIQGGQPVHQLRDRFGIRKVEIDGHDFKLNGEPVRTVGFNLVPEDRTTGNTLPLWRIKEDVDLMKSLGANMARLSHLPLPEEFLDYLDEKGIMTFEEVSLWGKDEMVDPEHPLPEYWLEKMIYVKYNHPSVVGWSIGNEIGFTDANPKVMDYVSGAIAHAKQLDPARLAIYVSHSASSQEIDPVQYSDLIMFNRYGNWGSEVEKAHTLHPGKPVFMAEYGNHLNSENLNEATIEADEMLDGFRGKPYMAGVSLWTFNDYRSFWKAGETWTTPPSQNRTWGIVDVFRQKKRAYDTFRKEYAPVKEMKVALEGETKSFEDASITIEPRAKLDIPAYTLDGYHLVWHLTDKEGKVLEGGFDLLPQIKPGDPLMQQEISWGENSADAFALQVNLLDPQDYSVLDTTLYFQVPDTPEIVTVHTAADQARVVFNRAKGATAYKVLYGKEELNQQTAATINDYVNITELDKLASYQFAVVAVNNAGESKPSQLFEARLDEDELPPVIRATVPYEDNFFIGYSVDRLDYMYEIAYGTQSGQYDHHFGLRNVGVCQIPDLESGKTYYYRFRNRKQWGFASEWTHEIKVDLREDKAERPVVLKGIIRASDQALLIFDPVDRAIGYNIYYCEKGRDQWMTCEVSSAVVRHAFVNELKENNDYEFRIEAILHPKESGNMSKYED